MRFFTVSLLAAILAATISSAHAKDGAAIPLQHGSYFILEGGWNAMEPTNAFNGLSLNTDRIKLKQGWALSGAGGYKFDNGLRTELEGSYHRNSYRNVNTPFFKYPLSGRQVTASVMGNILYDIHTGTRVTPYFGGGFGVTMVWMKDFTYLITGASPINAFINHESAKVAYQGIVGVAIAVAPQFEIVMDTRYRVSNGHTFRTLNTAGTYNSYSKYNVHEVTTMVGLRYAF